MSLLFIWRSGTRRFHLRVPDLPMNCRDLTMTRHQEDSPRQWLRVTCPILSTKTHAKSEIVVELSNMKSIVSNQSCYRWCFSTFASARASSGTVKADFRSHVYTYPKDEQSLTRDNAIMCFRFVTNVMISGLFKLKFVLCWKSRYTTVEFQWRFNSKWVNILSKTGNRTQSHYMNKRQLI